MDYRYFPDPDLLPLEISRAWIDQIHGEMLIDKSDPTSLDVPEKMAVWLKRAYGVSVADARALTVDYTICGYFREAVLQGPGTLLGDARTNPAYIKLCANFIISEVNKKRNESDDPSWKRWVSEETAGQLIAKVFEGTISLNTARQLFSEFWDEDKVGAVGMRDASTVDEIIEKRELKQVTDSTAIEKMVDDVIKANQKSVEEYKAGKGKALNALFGQVMKASNKTANPAQVTAVLKRKLAS